MSNAMIGLTTTLGYRDVGSSDTFTTLGEVIKITLPHQTTSKVEVTHYLSDGGRREYIPGLLDSGDMEVELNYYASQENEVRGLFGGTYEWQATYPDAATDTFEAFI